MDVSSVGGSVDERRRREVMLAPSNTRRVGPVDRVIMIVVEGGGGKHLAKKIVLIPVGGLRI